MEDGELQTDQHQKETAHMTSSNVLCVWDDSVLHEDFMRGGSGLSD